MNKRGLGSCISNKTSGIFTANEKIYKKSFEEMLVRETRTKAIETNLTRIEADRLAERHCRFKATSSK